jgi:hypothetical protein
MRTLYTGGGYLVNDDRASGGQKTEADVLGCNHCQKLLIGQQWREDGGFCGGCGKPVCGPCADKILLPHDQGGGCVPFVKLVDQALSSRHRCDALSRAAGLEARPPVAVGGVPS